MNQLRLCVSSALLSILCGSLLSHAAVITGYVKAEDTREGLIGANVLVEGTQLGAAAGVDGNYVVRGIPAGKYVIRATMLGYDAKTRSITLTEDEWLNLDLVLATSAIELQEVVITDGAKSGSNEREILDRMAAATITDAIGSETLRRLPDPDMSQVVRRATGVSRMDGNPVIRGLGLRYSKVTLNNSMVAGTEPNRSAVPLELFPTNLMRDVTVTKSFLPDQMGEFGGGAVNMSTWDYPEQRQMRISTSAGFNSATTLRESRTYQGGGLDFLGFDDGTRALPSGIANADGKIVSRGRFSETGYTSEELQQFGQSFQNSWNPVATTAMPNLSQSWSLGNRTQLWNRPLGYIVSGTYRNSQQYKESERIVYKGGANGSIEQQHNYDFQTYTNSVTLGGLTSFGYSISPLTRVSLNVLYNRDLDNETRLYSGYNDDRSKDVQDTRLRFVSRSTLSSQLSGRTVFPSVRQSILDWQVTFSRGTRYEPDTREVQYGSERGADEFIWVDATQSGSRTFSTLYDNMANAGADWTTPLLPDNALQLKTGTPFLLRHRDAETRFFQFEPGPNASLDLSLDPESLFSSENIRPDGFVIREATRPTDSYKANQHLEAAYVMLDANPLPRVRTIGGLRVENSMQEVSSYELFSASQTPVVGRISTLDVLPALQVVYRATDRSNLRFAVSQTVSRPDFRELSEFEYTDIVGGHAVIGNANLKRALIRHSDVRYEWAHGTADLIAASVFYKQFLNPVEEVIQPTAQNRVSYENAKSANNYGLELEIRQALGQLVPLLQPFAVSANLALIHSDIVLSDSSKGIQTSDRRPLHGQSPYLLNVELLYRHDRTKTQAGVMLHVFGKRISEVGSEPLPDVFEMPHPDLDITIERPLTRRMNVRAAAGNVLNSEVQFMQGGRYTERYRLGTTYSAGFSYNL